MTHSFRPLTVALLIFLAAHAAAAATSVDETVGKLGGYRLYPAKVGADEKPSLLVWLHPAGAAANQLVVPWQPQLAELGYALMLPRTTQPNTWRREDVKALVAFIDHAVANHGVDASKVVLLGYSAGGQVACHVAMRHADRVAGVVAMSGLPTRSLRDQRALMPPEKHKDSLAYFLLVGEDEARLTSASQAAQMQMLVAGFSVRVRVVQGAGHAFHDSERGAVLEWLKTVRAGKRPDHGVQPAQIAAYRQMLEHRARLFNGVAKSLGKPYKMTWKAAGEVELAGPVKLMLPEGWTVGATRGANGKTRAVRLQPPGDEHVVLFLGYSVKEHGLITHYQEWFEKLHKNNAVSPGKSDWITVKGQKWYLLTRTFTPREKFTDPLAKRALLVAVLPLNKKGTQWRSVTMMCPTVEAEKAETHELIRGLLERGEFGTPPPKQEPEKEPEKTPAP
jgi:predicted esterase